MKPFTVKLRWFPRDIEILGWCPAVPVLTSWGEGASLALFGDPFSDSVMTKMSYGVDVLHQPASHPGGVDISEVPGCLCYDGWILSVGHRNYFKDWTHSLPIFNIYKLKELKPYYQKHVNQIILNRTTL